MVLLFALSSCFGSVERTPESQPVQGAAASEEQVADVNAAEGEGVDTGAAAGENSDASATETEGTDVSATETEDETMRMSIAGTDVTVAWEDNQAVSDLRTLVADAPLTVGLSMYGGFEQVGSLGTTLTADDVQTTTDAGDIVLYAGDQIVVFYGSNTWAYTRLGHITSQSADGMADLLGNGDVSITISSSAGE